MVKHVFALAALLAFSAVHAQDDDQKFRLGIGAGKYTADSDLAEFKSTGWEVFGGYEFNRYLAIEAGYLDTGSDSKTISGLKVEVSASSIFASVIGSLPIGETFSVFARGGLLHWEADGTGSASGFTLTAEDDGDDLFLGVGLSAQIEGALFRLEYRFAEIDDVVDLSMIGLNLAWRF